MTRVLVVEDSAVVRELLVYILGSDPEIDIVGCAADGEEAIRMAQETRPDVITMDLHMPKLNGFDATRAIMQTCPTPIVIVCGSQAHGDPESSFRAIQAGALVVVPRPFGPGDAEHRASSQVLIRTVKSMAEVKVVRRWADRTRHAGPTVHAPAEAWHRTRQLVVVGASTGGPAVLRDILAKLPAGYRLPVVIVQHMAVGFVDSFAQWLSTVTGFPVRIAEQGAHLAGGHAYLAPDGFQLGITRDFRVALSSAAPEHGMRPSVSYLFRSIPEELVRATAAVLLTGMGKDGALELRQLKEQGALAIVQDRATAAVYGMPGEALRHDAATLVLDPVEIGKALSTLGREGAP